MSSLNCPFQYFASIKNETVYVLVPTANPIAFNGNFGEVENSALEEVLPDFRCKTCSVTFFNYSEFKDHQKDHETFCEEISKKSFASKNNQVKGVDNTNSRLNLDISANIKNGTISSHSSHSSPSGITNKSTKLMPNKVLISKASPNPLLIKELQETFVSKKTYIVNENSASTLKVSVVPKSEKHLKTRNEKLDAQFKKRILSKRPLIQTIKKSEDYASSSSKVLSQENVDLSSDKNNFEVKSELQKKSIDSTFTNKTHSTEISREGFVEEKINSPTAPSDTAFTFADNTLKEVFIKNGRNNTVPIIKPHSTWSGIQSQLMMQNEMADTERKELKWSGIFSGSHTEDKDNQTMHKFDGPFFATESFGDYAFSTCSNAKASGKEYNRNQITGYDECNSSKINILKSIEVNDNSITIPQTLTSVIGNKSHSTVATYSKCKVPTGKNNCDNALRYVESNLSKTSPWQPMEEFNHGIYTLQPLTKVKEKPLRCFLCLKTFKSCFEMKNHLREHEETNTLLCNLCQTSFTRVTNLRRHLLVFHCQAKIKRQCSYCDYKCFRASNLEEHTYRQHSINLN